MWAGRRAQHRVLEKWEMWLSHPALGNQDGVMTGAGAICDQQEATQIGTLQDFRGRRLGLVNPTRWVLERGRKNEMRDPL